MTEKQINIAIAESIGWRRWQFGDLWVKGLRLADQRFDGYTRRVIEDANSDSKTVKLDIDEAWTQNASEVKQNYTPVSHWVRGEQIRKEPANYHSSLDACAEFEAGLKKNGAMWVTYCNTLALLCGGLHTDDGGSFVSHTAAIDAPAGHRCESYLRTIGKWEASA